MDCSSASYYRSYYLYIYIYILFVPLQMGYLSRQMNLLEFFLLGCGACMCVCACACVYLFVCGCLLVASPCGHSGLNSGWLAIILRKSFSSSWCMYLKIRHTGALGKQKFKITPALCSYAESRDVFSHNPSDTVMPCGVLEAKGPLTVHPTHWPGCTSTLARTAPRQQRIKPFHCMWRNFLF